MMALKHDRINIEVFGPSAVPELARNGDSRADEAVLILARLLAREQFERKMALERRVQRKRPAGENV